VPEFSSIAHATDFANTDTLEASNEKPEQMPVLSDTSSYESLKNHLTDLRKYLLDNRQLRDSIIPNFWELCPIYFDMYRQNRSERANRVHEIVSDLPETNSINYRFIKSMVSHQDSSSMTYAKPLSAVFQGVTDRTSLFQTDITAAPEKEFLDNIKAHPATQVVRPSMMKSTTSYPYTDRKDSVFVYTQKERYKTSLLSFNYLSGSCRSYFYYELGAVSDKPDAEKILMASSMSLKLEYYQNDEIDEILFNAFPDICIDCPSSARFQKVFARLKGYENFYFTYTQEPQKELDDTYVPQRSLIYYDGDLLHTIWTTGVDLFGCSCL
jgi:hypothetical protein